MSDDDNGQLICERCQSTIPEGEEYEVVDPDYAGGVLTICEGCVEDDDVET